ncbi:hypothetical protein [Streptomyces yunnanensis]|uniref:Secreted protein n=1 Tax=Streptomyces yunnanensis TaxID=156453 RepID=A0A9X8N0G4_9ACTN|nr:hypothetical protein [Streptomyces yunnanensis]SHM51820.1 hypothetical protein SAMN05216268_111278 [Streptomyces yunnanensis]
MRMPRLLARRPRRAAVLAAALTTAALGTLASFANVYDGHNAGVTFGTPECSVSIEWRGAPGLIGSCTGTDPDTKVVTAYNDGWIDGQADLHGEHR